MVDLISSFRSMQSIKVVVIGDFVLDTYIMGSVSRISPEAPVPVLHAKEIKNVPGMSGNVALNLVSLGAKVFVMGRIGNDKEGELLIEYLKAEKIQTDGIIRQENYQTPVKQRMIASAQQLLRVDFEELSTPSLELKNQAVNYLKSIISQINVIALSDYKKGFLTDGLIEEIIALGKKHQVPVIVDPKGDDFSKYFGCTLIKPNLQEAYHASKSTKETTLDHVAAVLLKQTGAQYLLVTRSEEGMSLWELNHSRLDFPVKSREVKDVTGAGDTVLAMMTIGLGNHLPLSVCVQLSNIAASLVIQKVGCARVNLAQIAEALLNLDHHNKIFEEEHLFALNQILENQPTSILSLEKNQTMTTELFQAIRKIVLENSFHRLVVYIESTKDNQNLISLLSSLQEVGFILISAGNLSKLLEKILPQRAFHMKENKLFEVEQPSKILDHLLMQKVT